MRLSCDEGCSGDVTARLAGREVGRGSIAVPDAGARFARIPLDSSARGAIASRAARFLFLETTIRDAAGNTTQRLRRAVRVRYLSR